MHNKKVTLTSKGMRDLFYPRGTAYQLPVAINGAVFSAVNHLIYIAVTVNHGILSFLLRLSHPRHFDFVPPIGGSGTSGAIRTPICGFGDRYPTVE